MKSEHPRITAIILAAGGSQRMGQPKAFLTMDDTTFIDKIIRDYREIGCFQVGTVLGPDTFELKNQVTEQPDWIVLNPHPEKETLASIKIGLEQITGKCDGFFLHPVDHPALKVQTLELLLKAHIAHPGMIIRPCFENRGGHPIVLGSRLISAILNLKAAETMRELLHQNPDKVYDISVADPGVLINIDSPSDYKHLLRYLKTSSWQ